MHGSVVDWLTLAWPIFAWGAVVNAFFGIFRELSWKERQIHAGHVFFVGLLISAWAGLVEEICFRWLLFLPAIATTLLWNWIFGGWVALALIAIFGLALGGATKNGVVALVGLAGLPLMTYLIFGLPPQIPEWFHMNVWGPLANWTTFGALQDYIFHPTGFAVGAAMLYANAFFRDGHKYQGFFGVLNSWFLGMFFFYIMLHHGLPAAILVHFLYDVVVFSTSALILAFRNDLPAFE